MKTLRIFALTGICALGLTARLHSQAPDAPKTPLQQVEALKAQNQTLLEKQTATLLKLDELQKEATQIKILGKRT